MEWDWNWNEISKVWIENFEPIPGHSRFKQPLGRPTNSTVNSKTWTCSCTNRIYAKTVLTNTMRVERVRYYHRNVSSHSKLSGIFDFLRRFYRNRFSTQKSHDRWTLRWHVFHGCTSMNIFFWPHKFATCVLCEIAFTPQTDYSMRLLASLGNMRQFEYRVIIFITLCIHSRSRVWPHRSVVLLLSFI